MLALPEELARIFPEFSRFLPQVLYALCFVNCVVVMGMQGKEVQILSPEAQELGQAV